MKLFLNVVASYPEGTSLSDDDLDAIKEDVDDCLRYTGLCTSAHAVHLELEVKA